MGAVMAASIPEQNRTEFLLVEIVELRRELASLRRDSAVTLKMLTALLNAVRTLDRHEVSIEHTISDIAKEIDGLHCDHPQTSSHCPNCGAPIEHHDATAGDLRICTACGWSQFVDRGEGALPPTFPATIPATINSAAPSTWVE